jgi:hypothetical protein
MLTDNFRSRTWGKRGTPVKFESRIWGKRRHPGTHGPIRIQDMERGGTPALAVKFRSRIREKEGAPRHSRSN